MMGRSHALTGVLAATGTSLVTSADWGSSLLLISLLPGFTLLPDIDHPNSHVSKSFGLFSGIPARFLGHRRETHSLLGICAFGLLTQVAVINRESWFARAWLVLIIAIGWVALARSARVRGWLGYLPVVPAAVVVLFPDIVGFPLWVVPIAVGGGMFIHILGDMITMDGCPLLWPISSRRTRWRWFKTNSTGETIMQVAVSLGIVTSTAGWIWLY